jgi:predicted permease
MVSLREWIKRLWGTLRPSRDDQDLEQELRLHLELAAEDALRRGTPESARRVSRIDMSGMTQAMETLRDQRGFPWLADLAGDARYTVRTMRKSSAFAIAAIVTLALGIGATTAIYSLVDTILVKPLPAAGSGVLVRVVENVPSRLAGRPPVQRGITYPNFLEWRSRSRTLDDAFGVMDLGRLARTVDGTARLWGGMISSNAFAVLGARALLGRTLDAADDAHPDVLVLSFDTWRRVFHSDERVIGTTIEFRSDWNGSNTPELERRLLTIVGVLPAAFELPTGSLDFYTPFILDDLTKSASVTLIGRLRPGVSLADAITEANTIGGAIRPRPANAATLTVPRFDVQILKERMVQELRPALHLFLSAVVLVLLIVCANVANLLLARGTARQREISIRIAIGASRERVVRQLLTECLVLAIAGGVAGALLAAGGVALVKNLASVDAPGLFRLSFPSSIFPRVNEVRTDAQMLGIAFGIAALTSVVFGVLPALHLSRAEHLNAMGPRGTSSRVAQSRMRSALVIGQVVMATVLLIGAGLLIRSFVKLSTIEKGYDPANVLAFQVVFPPDYSTSRKTDTIDRVLTRLRAHPGVEAAGFTRAGILIPEEIHVGTFVPRGKALDEMRADPLLPRLRPVSPGYLTAMRVPLLAGREFQPADANGSTPTIVISRSVANRYFGTENPVSQFVDWYVGKGPAVPIQVVGAVEDVRNASPDHPASPDIFIEYHQLLALQQRWGDSPRRQAETTIGFVSFAVRTRGNPASTIPSVSKIIHGIDPDAGIDAILPMEQLVARSIARPRFYAVILSVFAGVAGLLAAIGIYGVLAYAVAQRTQEIGIRMALGAQRSQVVRLVLHKGMILTSAGILLGILCAAASARVIQGMLFGVNPVDRSTFLAVSVLFGVVATLACYIPARRASMVDPMVALRND